MKKIKRKDLMQKEELSLDAEELSLDELELVTGGIMSKQLTDAGGSAAATMNFSTQVQCPKCLKIFEYSGFDDTAFQQTHVAKCTGPET